MMNGVRSAMELTKTIDVHMFLKSQTGKHMISTARFLKSQTGVVILVVVLDVK